MHNVTELAINEMKEFEQNNHRPSDEQMEALTAIPETLTSMAMGNVCPLYHVSGIDAGVGKSTAIVAWVRVLLRYEDYNNIGVIVFVDRLEEINRFIRDMGLAGDQYSAVVADDRELSRSGLGKDIADKARILFTTKEQIRRRCQDRRLNELREFFFKGGVRPVRIWDESLAVGEPITVSNLDLGRLLKPLRWWPELCSTIQGIMATLGNAKSGEVFDVPSLGTTSKEWTNLFGSEVPPR